MVKTIKQAQSAINLRSPRTKSLVFWWRNARAMGMITTETEKRRYRCTLWHGIGSKKVVASFGHPSLKMMGEMAAIRCDNMAWQKGERSKPITKRPSGNLG